ncbi:hypothetical protein GLYMA_02G234450v4 [Glycine max]|nr:hypothetical protein GLYMA_02G234450v4 [Glycine max]
MFHFGHEAWLSLGIILFSVTHIDPHLMSCLSQLLNLLIYMKKGGIFNSWPNICWNGCWIRLSLI